MSECEPELRDDGTWQCPKCGNAAATFFYANCKSKRKRRNAARAVTHKPSKLWLSARRFIPWNEDDAGLGDFLARVLDSGGVTKERWLRFAKRIGAVPQEAETCGCEARQAELNRRFPRA